MKSAYRQIITWIVLVAAMAALRGVVQFTPNVSTVSDAMGQDVLDMTPDRLATVTTFAFLLLGAWLSGIITKAVGLPKITGYMLFGIIVGPSLTPLFLPNMPALVSRESIENLKLVNAVAIALIGLTAGGEICIGLFRKGFAAVVIISGVGTVVVFVGVAALLWFARSQATLLQELASPEVLIIAMVCGIIATANSPAVVLAMLSETGAKGPMSEIGLAVVVCKDLLLVIIFTIVTAIGISVLGSDDSESASRGAIVANLVWHMLGSVVFGGAIGLMLATIMDRIGRRMPLLVVATALGIALVSDALGFESLLAALTAGFILANVWPVKSAPLFHSIEEISTPIFCVFFAITGTAINISDVMEMWPLALGIFVMRFITMSSGSALGCKLAGQPPASVKWMWTMFTANAGVAIALTQTISKSFAEFEWAAPLVSLLLSTIAIDQLFGPIIMKHGLSKAGEISN